MQKIRNLEEKEEIRKFLVDKLFLMRKVRFVIGLCIIFWGLILYFFSIPGFNPTALLLVALCEMLINQPYSFITNRIKNLNWVILFHQIFDVILISLCIYFLGGTDAYFAIILYSLIIIFAGVIVSIKSSFLIASLCSLSYLIMFDLEFFEIIPKSTIFKLGLTPQLKIIVLIFICTSLFLIAYVSSFLSKIITKKSEESKAALDKLKFAEDAMIQAEKLAAVGQFASGVIHEVKNPLGVVVSGVEFLESEVSDRPDLVESIKRIKKSALHANEIIKGVLNFSRPANEQLQILDLNMEISDTIRLLKGVKIGPNIQIVREFSKTPIIAKLNKNQLEEVVYNIITNACEAMPGGGRIFIRTYRQEYNQEGLKSGFRESSRFVFGEKIAVLEVQDEGIGIAEEDISNIFDPFFTTKHKKENAGLGLSICRRIIDAHNGEIEVKSVHRKGTIIVIKLPLFEEKKRR
ncbi:hypothetical protein HQ550_04685 [bacterium]|nr:hypothetical protein [bacterium]